MRTSAVEARGQVTFPEFTGERVYMQQFFLETGLPERLARWQPVVDRMLEGVETEGAIFIMIDQALVKAGTPQRRPGIHVDGAWVATLGQHDNGGGQHRQMPPTPDTERPHWTLPSRHETRDCGKQAIMLASDHFASYGYVGDYPEIPNEDGSFDSIDLSNLEPVALWPHTVWAGDAYQFLHESTPVPRDCHRTLVRLNVCGWLPRSIEFPENHNFPDQENEPKQERFNHVGYRGYRPDIRLPRSPAPHVGSWH